ncbi:flippase [Vibrio sp. 10N.222.54.B6]|uniref:flippase n=1 Tax=Vibrio sp. 10N.222.54.B6 TaxID=1884468 RepID=UPI000C85039C|nr:flippase [Vibrio sp. 10N.222.54.B6]PMO17530.1 polysaccharide biosynthesis protein [Vibrio sp. 10N.222.54.B6]
MFDRVIIKNISSLFSMRIGSYIIPLITLPYLVRTLGVEGYGYLGFSFAIMQYMILAVNYGFDLSATSEIAKSKGDKYAISKVFWNVSIIRVVTALSCFPLIIIASAVFETIDKITPILFACYVSVISTALFPQWLFQGKEQLGVISTVRVVLQFFTIPLLFIFVKNSNNIWQAALINGIPIVGVAFIGLILINKRRWICWTRPTWVSLKSQYKEGFHIFISTASISLYTTSVVIILGAMSGAVSVGYFTAADRLIKAVLGLYGTISNAFYPRVNSVVIESKVKAIILIRKLAKLLFFTATVSSVLLFLLSEYIVKILFGAEFVVTSELLKILAWLPMIICLSNIFGVQVLIPFGYKKDFSRILIYSGIASLLFLIPLIYNFDEYGAATSIIITELVVTLLMWLTVKNKKLLRVNNEI